MKNYNDQIWFRLKVFQIEVWNANSPVRVSVISRFVDLFERINLHVKGDDDGA